MSKLQTWGLVLLALAAVYCFTAFRKPSTPDMIIVAHRPRGISHGDLQRKINALNTEFLRLVRFGTDESSEKRKTCEAKRTQIEQYLSEDITTISSPKEIQSLRAGLGTFFFDGFSFCDIADGGMSPIEIFGLKNGQIIWGIKVYPSMLYWKSTTKDSTLYNTIMKRYPPKLPAATNDETTKS